MQRLSVTDCPRITLDSPASSRGCVQETPLGPTWYWYCCNAFRNVVPSLRHPRILSVLHLCRRVRLKGSATPPTNTSMINLSQLSGDCTMLPNLRAGQWQMQSRIPCTAGFSTQIQPLIPCLLESWASEIPLMYFPGYAPSMWRLHRRICLPAIRTCPNHISLKGTTSNIPGNKEDYKLFPLTYLNRIRCARTL